MHIPHVYAVKGLVAPLSKKMLHSVAQRNTPTSAGTRTPGKPVSSSIVACYITASEIGNSQRHGLVIVQHGLCNCSTCWGNDCLTDAGTDTDQDRCPGRLVRQDPAVARRTDSCVERDSRCTKASQLSIRTATSSSAHAPMPARRSSHFQAQPPRTQMPTHAHRCPQMHT